MKSKHLILILVIVASGCFLQSCSKPPSANFIPDKDEYFPGDVMKLTNTSVHGYTYKWSGTGISGELSSTDVEVPITGIGLYEITLTAYSNNGKRSNLVTKAFNVRKPYGRVTFYSLNNNPGGSLSVNIDNQNQGYIYPITTAPACGSSLSGCFTASLDVGKHFVSSYYNGASLYDSVTVTAGSCQLFSLF